MEGEGEVVIDRREKGESGDRQEGEGGERG